MRDDTDVLLRKSRRKVLLLTIVPLIVFLLLLLIFGVWRFSESSSDKETATPVSKDQPINEVSLSELQSLEPTTLSINRANQLVVNGELTANGAFVIREGIQPTDPEAGQVFFDQGTDEIRYYDGTNFITLLGSDRATDICYIGEDCGFLSPGDVATSTIPSPFIVSNLTDNTVLLGNGTGVIQTTSVPNPGQILIGSNNNVPVFRTLSGDATITQGGNFQLASNSVGASELRSTTVTPGTYGDFANYPVITVDQDGRISAVSTQPDGGGGLVTSVNALVGNIVIAGTADQINVVSGGSTITLSTPQDIATTSSPTFADLDLTGNLSVDGNTTLGDNAADTISINGTIQGGTPLSFEGSSADGTETFFAIAEPTGVDKTITFPNASGDVCLTSGNCVGSGGGSAPNDAEYLTLSLDPNLSDERLLNPGSSLTVTDNGANGTFDINTI